MLKKTNRLAKSKDIQKAFARGRSFFNPFFNIKFLASAQHQRFTVVISTKVYKNAVSRNRLKRLLREHVRNNLSSFKKGDYIIVVKPKVKSLEEKEILKYFLEACLRLK